ncbi:MAG: hypothetical protein WKF96_00005 [Solirubrobacteraceae bacterium]
MTSPTFRSPLDLITNQKETISMSEIPPTPLLPVATESPLRGVYLNPADALPPSDEPVDVPFPADEAPSGRLTRPEVTNGIYVVLSARKPTKGDTARPSYREVAYVPAGSPEAAKKAVMNDPAHDHLKRSAAQKPGILLRAVPAMHWPDEVKATTFTTPEPVLSIG